MATPTLDLEAARLALLLEATACYRREARAYAEAYAVGPPVGPWAAQRKRERREALDRYNAASGGAASTIRLAHALGLDGYQLDAEARSEARAERRRAGMLDTLANVPPR